jgi:tRNA nucleotidyltransferase (CCA-adding enzyme)
MALAEVMSEPSVQDVLARFPFTEAERSAITAARFTTQDICRQLRQRTGFRPSEIVRMLSSLSDETLVFLLAKNRPETAKRQIAAYLTTYRTVKPVLTGKELKSYGLAPGPLYSTILARLTEARLDGEITSEAEEWELVKQLANRASATT